MTTERDIRTRIVLSWLREDLNENAERVLLHALDEVDTTPQRRPFRAAWRFPTLSNPLRYGIAAAAVLAVALIGYQFLPTNPSIGSGPSTAPSASRPAPTQELAASPTTPGSPPVGAVPAGTYAWSWPGGVVTFDVPPGWTGAAEQTGMHKHPDQAGEITLAHWLPGTPAAVSHVYTDACDSEGKLVEVGPSPDDLITALDDQVGTDAAIKETMVGGLLTATQIDLVDSPGLDRQTCPQGAAGPLSIWNDREGGDWMYGLAPDYRGTVYVIDVHGDRVVLTTAIHSEASPEDLAELDAIIDSMRWPPS